MKLPYKILIIITFLIACFFLGRWAYSQIPRYYYIKQIIVRDDNRDIDCYDDKCLITKHKKEGDYYVFISQASIKVKDYFCDWLPTGENEINTFENTLKICYIIEKIRKN